MNGNEKDFNLIKLETLKAKPYKKYESKTNSRRRKSQKIAENSNIKFNLEDFDINELER